MLICVPDVLSKTDVAKFRAAMDAVRLGGRPIDRGGAIRHGQKKRTIAAGR